MRFVPEGGALVEVSCRAIQSRLLLRPSPAVSEIIVGVLGRAQERSGIRCHAVAFLSNHWHGLFSVEDARQLADFMQYVESNLAREIGREVGWREKFWGRRYSHSLVSWEPYKQVERLAYVLSQSVKENLVVRVRDWPGVHSVRALVDGEPLAGCWFNRTQEWAARNRGEKYDRYEYATKHELVLTPIPCWAHLSPERYRERVAAIIEEIETAAAMAREKTGKQPLGREKILAQNPHDRPVKTKKSPNPAFLAGKEARKALREAYAAFLAAFLEASEQLRSGDRNAVFPVGCFPPALPFVSAYPARGQPP